MGNLRVVEQPVKFMYFDSSQTPMGIWCHWRVSNPWTYIALYFEYFETTENLNIALYVSEREWLTNGLINGQKDGQMIQLHIMNAPANLSGRRIKTSLFLANKYSG